MRVDVASEFERVQKALTAAADGKAVRAAMNKRIREATKPLVKQLQDAVRAVPVTSTRGSGSKARFAHAAGGRELSEKSAATLRGGAGLRETVAKAIQTKVTNSGPRQGIRIRVDGTKLPPNQRRLPKFLDGQGRWRHPTFGRDPWVLQTGRPWWTPTLRAGQAAVKAEIAKILNDVLEGLTP